MIDLASSADLSAARRRVAVIVGLYVVIAATYIVASSLWVGERGLSPVEHAGIETAKGVGFVLVTGAGLAVVLYRDYRRLLAAQEQHHATLTELARAQHATSLAAITAAITHDMRNMVGAAMLSTSVAREGAQGDVAEALDDLDESLRRLADSTAELMTRASQATSARPPEAVALPTVLTNCVRLAKVFERHHACKLVVECPSGLRVVARRSELEHALVNLVVNAIQANERRGRVTLTATEEGENVRLSIVDQGPGVPAELGDRIFEPFVSTKGQNGNGIGLSVTRALLRDMQGDVRLVDAPGPGARFDVTLPRG